MIITKYLTDFNGDLIVLPELSIYVYLFPSKEELALSTELVPKEKR